MECLSDQRVARVAIGRVHVDSGQSRIFCICPPIRTTMKCGENRSHGLDDKRTIFDNPRAVTIHLAWIKPYSNRAWTSSDPLSSSCTSSSMGRAMYEPDKRWLTGILTKIVSDEVESLCIVGDFVVEASEVKSIENEIFVDLAVIFIAFRRQKPGSPLNDAA